MNCIRCLLHKNVSFLNEHSDSYNIYYHVIHHYKFQLLAEAIARKEEIVKLVAAHGSNREELEEQSLQKAKAEKMAA